ncbi:MAG TPA: cupredoxin domain-containing protein, partial [Spirochaetota bacterium]|nr:cupredoxin domain-containing protein [Spirochaetota bacterium]
PVLFLTGVTSKFSQNPKFSLIKRTGAMLIVVFAVYTFFSGLSVINFKGNIFNSVNNGNTDKTITNNKNDEIQIVKMSIKYYGYEPEIIKVKKGVKVRWEIYGEEVTGCTNAIIFPYMKQRFNTPKEEVTVIEFTPDKKGYLPFSCWMGMVRGTFLVE